MVQQLPRTPAGTPLSTIGLGRRALLQRSAAGGAGLLGAALLGTRSGHAADTPKRGGNLRVAMLGGNSSDTLDAHTTVTQPDTARVMMLYDPLVTIGNDARVVNALAESIEPNATATEWTIRLRRGVTFHNGKPLKAEDVVFTFKRMADPKNPLVGATSLQPVDFGNIRIVDDLTLVVPMKSPYAAFPQCISAPVYFGIVPVGYDPAKPVGTGPFKFASFTPGQQSVVTRFADYWNGPAYLDSITLTDFSVDTAAFNALQGGEVDVFAYAPLTLVGMIGQNSQLKSLVSRPGQWTPFTMRIDQPPFDNPDVRLAMRLLVDRQQMIDVALNGYGKVAADVFGPSDPCYDASLVRERDVDRAKFLLKKAGHENLAVELVTADIANGVVQQAQVFAQQAKDAGVAVSLRNVTTDVFFGDQYLKWPFAQDYWDYSPYLSQIVQGYRPGAPFNETHWTDDAWLKLYDAAQATIDEKQRCEIIHQMQKIDFERGGYIIASFNQSVDLMTKNVQGFEPGASGYALGTFSWAKAWLA